MLAWRRRVEPPQNENALHNVLVALLAGESTAEAISHGSDGRLLAALQKDVAEATSGPAWRIAQSLAVRLQSVHWHQNALFVLAQENGNGVDSRPIIAHDEFFTDYYYKNRALHLTAVASDWAAVTKWNQQYLKDRCGDAPVEIMVGRQKAAQRDQNTSARLKTCTTWAAYVDSVFGTSEGNDFYLVSRNYAFDNPKLASLLEDVGALSFVNTRASGRAVRMWFGPKGTFTPWHHDDRNNVIVELLGRKRVRLCPPYCGEYAQQATMWYSGVGRSQVTDGASPDLNSLAVSVDLRRGDALFIPVGWWHEVEALEPSLTLACVDFGKPNVFDRDKWHGLSGLKL